jgi:hypothetical protein
MDKVSGRQSRVPIKDIDIVVDITKLRIEQQIMSTI